MFHCAWTLEKILLSPITLQHKHFVIVCHRAWFQSFCLRWDTQSKFIKKKNQKQKLKKKTKIKTKTVLFIHKFSKIINQSDFSIFIKITNSKSVRNILCQWAVLDISSDTVHCMCSSPQWQYRYIQNCTIDCSILWIMIISCFLSLTSINRVESKRFAGFWHQIRNCHIIRSI